ncbi:nicotinamidase-related amidase [Rhizobium tropici]|nr:nicotinamidase-related amidase [Rhizobium tropici]MBB5591770.1 nicotinamidase-related amidase [Rhizobium tropici]MBB6490824.1 nicotinamidase-related amidase [Rhizobium tropici]
MFFEQTPWHVPWMARTLDQVVEVAGRFPERTLFTRFIPPARADAMPGKWQDYYEKWEMMTASRLPHELMLLIDPLQRFVPPARIFDKLTYSPWTDGRLHRNLVQEGIDTLVISGGETDVCVLAGALGAIELGYGIIVLKDAVCSGDDDAHEAALTLLERRFSVQSEIMTVEEFLSAR